MIWVLIVFLVVQVDERSVLDMSTMEIGTYEKCMAAGTAIEDMMTIDGLVVSWQCRPLGGAQ